MNHLTLRSRVVILGLLAPVLLVLGLVGACFPLPPRNVAYVAPPHRPRFVPLAEDAGTRAHCRVVLTQKEPYVFTPRPLQVQPPPSGQRTDAPGEGPRPDPRERTQALNASLAGHGLSDAYLGAFQASLSTALGASPWLHSSPVATARERSPVTLSEVDGQSLLLISLNDDLGEDGSTLRLGATLRYFRPHQLQPVFQRTYTYYSERMAGRDESAVNAWLASDQALLRRCLREGGEELVAMMVLDFLCPEPIDPAKPLVPITHDHGPEHRPIVLHGHILRVRNGRLLFQENAFDQYFSLVPCSPGASPGNP